MVNNHFKIATPISDLFYKEPNASLIIDHSDCLETRDRSVDSNLPNQELFHCELQPIHQFTLKEIKYLEMIKRKKPELKLISFHLASCYKNPVIRDGKFYPKGKKISKDQLIINANNNIKLIKKIFKNGISIAVENNNHYSTEAYDFVTSPHFIRKVVNDNNINFLYDIAHAKISSHNMSISNHDYEKNLPMNKLIQVHIAKPAHNNIGEIYDKHDLPTKFEINETINLIRRFPSVKYLTVEYYKNCIGLVNVLKQLKMKLDEIKR